MHRIRRLRRFLRHALLLVVAFGVLLQPVLGAVRDLHDVEHAVAAQADDRHVHLDSRDDPADAAAPGDPTVAHSLLHDAGFAASMALLDVAFRAASLMTPGDPLACLHAAGPPIACMTPPFRPPIA